MPDLEQFLRHNLERYLFGDLKRMQGQPLGYPPLLSAFAGTELLGGLLNPKPFSRKTSGATRFVHYWTEYLYPDVPDRVAVARAVYQLARHGIAHGFFPKGPIGVGGPDLTFHLKRDADGLVIIHPTQLGEDLIASYERRVKPIIRATTGSPSRKTMGKQLAIMLRLAERDAKKHDLVVIFPAATSGAPGPAGLSHVTTSAAVGVSGLSR